eukprot:COSAG02_NODE_15892_length_1132_cov_10.438529_1_plen_115_part_00
MQCAVSPTGVGAAASPAKANSAGQPRHACDTSSLRAPSATKKDMEDRIAMFMMETRGGNCTHRSDQNRKGPDRICQQCTGDDCSFCVIATYKKSVWAVKFDVSHFRHQKSLGGA